MHCVIVSSHDIIENCNTLLQPVVKGQLVFALHQSTGPHTPCRLCPTYCNTLLQPVVEGQLVVGHTHHAGCVLHTATARSSCLHIICIRVHFPVSRSPHHVMPLCPSLPPLHRFIVDKAPGEIHLQFSVQLPFPERASFKVGSIPVATAA